MKLVWIRLHFIMYTNVYISWLDCCCLINFLSHTHHIASHIEIAMTVTAYVMIWSLFFHYGFFPLLLLVVIVIAVECLLSSIEPKRNETKWRWKLEISTILFDGIRYRKWNIEKRKTAYLWHVSCILRCSAVSIVCALLCMCLYTHIFCIPFLLILIFV